MYYVIVGQSFHWDAGNLRFNLNASTCWALPLNLSLNVNRVQCILRPLLKEM